MVGSSSTISSGDGDHDPSRIVASDQLRQSIMVAKGDLKGAKMVGDGDLINDLMVADTLLHNGIPLNHQVTSLSK